MITTFFIIKLFNYFCKAKQERKLFPTLIYNNHNLHLNELFESNIVQLDAGLIPDE